MKWDHIFCHPMMPHKRKHGPLGYERYQSMKPWLRDEFEFRCVYCLEREQFSSDGADRFATEHFENKAGNPTKTADYENLFFSCIRCNTLKGIETVANPTDIGLAELIRCLDDGRFVEVTPEGKDLIDLLQLNDTRRVAHRFRIISVCRMASRTSANKEIQQVAFSFLKYPDDLPDLRTLKPPGGNSRPEGVDTCHFRRRELGELPPWY